MPGAFRPATFAAACAMLLQLVGAALCAAQSNAQAACPSAEVVLQRYIDAVGGAGALEQIQTRTTEANETEPYSFKPQDTATYKYRFRWKAPNKVATKRTHIVPMFKVPVDFGSANFIFDGEQWSDFQGRPNPGQHQNEPAWRRRLVFPYPFFAMYRVAADPLMIARAKELYSSFDLQEDDGQHPGLCVVRAVGTDCRADLLYFDVATGLLRTWDLQIYQPRRSFYVRFRFDDYREVGPVKFPYYLYMDFYRATFRYTKVVHNPQLRESDFEIQMRAKLVQRLWVDWLSLSYLRCATSDERASSSAVMASWRVTAGKSSRKSSSVWPRSR